MRAFLTVSSVAIIHFILCGICLYLTPDWWFPSQGRADTGAEMANPAVQSAAASVLVILLVPLGPLNGVLWGVVAHYFTRPRGESARE